MDSFAYATVRRRRSRLGRAFLYLLLAAVLVAGVGYGVLGLTRTGGEAVGQHLERTTEQVDAAADARARANLRLALSAALTAFAEGGSFSSASATDLPGLEPSVTYVDGSRASNDPGVVSVEATDQAWGAAALSSSGTCFFVRDVSGSRAFGSGEPCTGEAAMAVTGSHF